MAGSRRITFIVFFVGVVTALSAVAIDGVDVSIRLYDTTIYYPESDIMILVTIMNDSAQTFRFRLAENRVFNVEFDVRTLTNMRLAPAEHFITQRNSNQPVYFREVAIEPGERFSFVENLSRYVSIDESGMFVVSAVFYPDLVSRNRSTTILSDRLMVSVRPAIDRTDEIATRIDHETGEILRAVARPPDEVIAYTIDARRAERWERFFLYLDIEALYRSAPQREREYLRLSDENRRAALERFKTRLREGTEDPEITFTPSSYEIIRTTYGRDEGTVIVDKRFTYPTYTELKRYTYTLHRRAGIWYITGYTVRNMGTE